MIRIMNISVMTSYLMLPQARCCASDITHKSTLILTETMVFYSCLREKETKRQGRVLYSPVPFHICVRLLPLYVLLVIYYIFCIYLSLFSLGTQVKMSSVPFPFSTSNNLALSVAPNLQPTSCSPPFCSAIQESEQDASNPPILPRR